MAQDPRASLAKADKLLNSSGGFFSKLTGGNEEKFEEAANLIKKAANDYKVQGLSQEAGDTYLKAAQVYTTKLDNALDASECYNDAYKAFRSIDSQQGAEQAVRCAETLINDYTSKGRFAMAAKYKKELGDLFETKLGDQKRAVEAYETAAKWYEGENSRVTANNLYLKVADAAAAEGDYQKAIDLYEKVAQHDLSHNSLSLGLKDKFFKAGICFLVMGDLIATRRALEKYFSMDPGFSKQRECKLLEALVQATEEGNKEAFEDRLMEWNAMTPLTPWQTDMFLRAKKNVTQALDDEFS